jgi:hypothetical protein
MPEPTSLFLAPADTDAAPDPASVTTVLDELGIIAQPLSGTGLQRRFAAGPGFARHVVFAGCSPYLVTTPPPGGGLDFSHVAVHGPWPQARLYTGPNTVKPRCPHCRARFADWRERLAQWQEPGASVTCPGCGAVVPVRELDWRGHALSGRLLIEFTRVFAGEAAPDDRLVAALQRSTGVEWSCGWAGSLEEG